MTITLADIDGSEIISSENDAFQPRRYPLAATGVHRVVLSGQGACLLPCANPYTSSGVANSPRNARLAKIRIRT